MKTRAVRDAVPEASPLSKWLCAAKGDGGPPPGSAPPVGAAARVAVHKKSHRELSKLRVVQEVRAHEGVIWCMRFSTTGQSLATGGQDTVVRVWAALDRSAPARPCPGAADRAPAPGGAPCGESPVLSGRPVRELRGHTADVLDVSWSGAVADSDTEFLLSASMDRSVRLWHPASGTCLRVFPHGDYVTAAAFLPGDGTRFMSGSVDGKVYLWGIPESSPLSVVGERPRAGGGRGGRGRARLRPSGPPPHSHTLTLTHAQTHTPRQG